jgi:putative flippase GtrA
MLIQFIKFGVVGFSNTIISYAIYYALVYVNVHYIAANIAAFAVGALNSFFWNNKYVFKKHDNEKRDTRSVLVKTYISYAFTGLVLSNILMYVLVDMLRVSKYLAPVFCLAVTIPLNFVLNKMWAFRDRAARDINNE